MRRDLVEEILRNQEHVTHNDGRFSIPEGLRVELLAAPGSEVIALGAAREIRFAELYVVVSTEKDETYFVEYETIFGVKIRGKAEGRPIGRAGFTP